MTAPVIDERMLSLGIAYCEGALYGYAFRLAELRQATEHLREVAFNENMQIEAYSKSTLGQLAGCAPWGCYSARLDCAACAVTCHIAAPLRVAANNEAVWRAGIEESDTKADSDSTRGALDALVLWRHRMDKPPNQIMSSSDVSRAVEAIVLSGARPCGEVVFYR